MSAKLRVQTGAVPDLLCSIYSTIKMSHLNGAQLR